MTVLDCTPTSARSTADIQCVGFTVLDHPPCTPNLAVLDFHLKERLRGHHCALEDEVKAVVKFILHQYAEFCNYRLMKTL